MIKLLPNGFKAVNYRTSRGVEGDCYSFNIKHGRTLVCEVTDDGWGGEVQINWRDDAGAVAVKDHAFRAVADWLANMERNPSIGDVEPDEAAATRFEAVTTWDELEALCKYVSAEDFWAEQVAWACADAKAARKAAK